MRRLVDGESVQFPRGLDRHHAVLAGAALGAFPVLARQGNFAADPRAPRRGDTDPHSLFLVVILLVVILIVVIGLTGRMMRRVALVVP